MKITREFFFILDLVFVHRQCQWISFCFFFLFLIFYEACFKYFFSYSCCLNSDMLTWNLFRWLLFLTFLKVILHFSVALHGAENLITQYILNMMAVLGCTKVSELHVLMMLCNANYYEAMEIFWGFPSNNSFQER